MGFLGELKKGTHKEQAQRDEQNSADLRRQQFSRAIQATRSALHTYLNGLVEHLSRVLPDALISYEVEGCPCHAGLKQRNFAVDVNDPEQIQTCTLRCLGAHDRNVDFYPPIKKLGERAAVFVETQAALCIRKSMDERWVFALESYVPVEFEYQIEAEKLAVKLKGLNHDSLGVVSYPPNLGDINPLYLDEFAKYVVTKPSRGRALSGDVVPDATLARLRQQVAERKTERAQELGEESSKPKDYLHNKGLLKK